MPKNKNAEYKSPKEIVRNILDNISKEITTSQDIIPVKERNQAYAENNLDDKCNSEQEMTAFLKRFSRENTLEFYKHNRAVRRIRDCAISGVNNFNTYLANSNVDFKQLDKIIPININGKRDYFFASSFASALNAHGECGEVTSMTILRLLQEEFKLPLLWIALYEKSSRKSHTFIIGEETFNHSNTITLSEIFDFSYKKNIYIDPLLKLTENCDHLLENLKLFFDNLSPDANKDLFNQKFIVKVLRVTNSDRSAFEYLFKIATQFKAEVLDKLPPPEVGDIAEDVNDTFNKLVRMTLFKHGCTQPNESGTLFMSAKVFEQCLRRCAVNGDRQGLLIMLQTVANIDATAPSNNLTALDYARQKNHIECVNLILDYKKIKATNVNLGATTKEPKEDVNERKSANLINSNKYKD